MHLRYPIKKQQVELRSVNTSESVERMKPWRRSPLLAVSSALLRPIYQREKRENNSHYPWPHTVTKSQIVARKFNFQKNSKFWNKNSWFLRIFKYQFDFRAKNIFFLNTESIFIEILWIGVKIQILIEINSQYFIHFWHENSNSQLFFIFVKIDFLTQIVKIAKSVQWREFFWIQYRPKNLKIIVNFFLSNSRIFPLRNLTTLMYSNGWS